MPWYTPKTWVDGELVTAPMLNEQIRDNMNELIPGHAVVADATARNAISPLVAGVMVYQSDINGLFLYDGANWRLVRTT
jgi:hypothetical protein